MLANGATLEYKSKSVTSFAKLKGLKEIPEIGVDRSDAVPEYHRGGRII